MRWNYFAAVAVSRADAQSRARSCAARSRPTRRQPSTKAASSSRRRSDPGYVALVSWANAARSPAGRDARSGLRFFAQTRAADAREEGLHDGAVPLGGDVPRLPPARRLGRELLVLGDAMRNYDLRGRADVVRERRRRARAASCARTCIGPRSVTGRTASRIAAGRCSKTSPRTTPALCDATDLRPGRLRLRRTGISTRSRRTA